jgi:hypothetical protein
MLIDHQIPAPIIQSHPMSSYGSPPEVNSNDATAVAAPGRPEPFDDDASMEPLPFSAAAVADVTLPDPTQQQATEDTVSSLSRLNAATALLKSNFPNKNSPQPANNISPTAPDKTNAPTTTTTSTGQASAGTATASKKDSLDCPHPKDILFPIFGYQLWAGNVRFIRLIKSKRPDFDNAESRSVQATMAIKVMEAVEKDGGRFLTAVETPDNDHAMIVCTTRWRQLNKREILTEIIKFLKRRDAESLREANRARRETRREVKLKCRRTGYEALISPQLIPSEDGTEAFRNEPKGPIAGPLMALYYEPPFIGAQHDSDENDDDDEDEESGVASEESMDDNVDARPKRKPLIQRPVPKKKSPPKKKKKAATASPANGNPKNGGFGKPNPGKSLEAAKDEGVIDLPKGVTVRPSGKWVSVATLHTYSILRQH